MFDVRRIPQSIPRGPFRNGIFYSSLSGTFRMGLSMIQGQLPHNKTPFPYSNLPKINQKFFPIRRVYIIYVYMPLPLPPINECTLYTHLCTYATSVQNPKVVPSPKTCSMRYEAFIFSPSKIEQNTPSNQTRLVRSFVWRRVFVLISMPGTGLPRVEVAGTGGGVGFIRRLNCIQRSTHSSTSNTRTSSTATATENSYFRHSKWSKE